MSDEPMIDGRRQEELSREIAEIAPYYTDDWEPGTGDGGTAVTQIFSELAEQVVERLDRVPEKHRVSFYETLGFTREPPQSARAPVSFEIPDGVERNVPIRAGTEATAPAADDRPEQTFRVAAADAFEATPANITSAYSIDPETDAIYEHSGALTADDETTLFRGADRQAHVFYIGHPDQLSITPSEADSGEGAGTATIQVSLETDTPIDRLRGTLVWEYYGERDIDGETVEGWHAVRGTAGQWPVAAPADVSAERVVESTIRYIEDQGHELTAADARALRQEIVQGTAFEISGTPPVATLSDGGRTPTRVSRTAGSRSVAKAQRLLEAHVRSESSSTGSLPTETSSAESDQSAERESNGRTLSLAITGTPTVTEVAGIESRWIRARIPDWYTDGELFDVTIGNAEAVEPRDPVRVGPEHNASAIPPDTLLDNDVELSHTGEDGAGVLPLGTVPRPQDAFYVASAEVFSKKGTTVDIVFEPPPSEEVYLERYGTEAAEKFAESEREESTYAELGYTKSGMIHEGTESEGVDPNVTWEYWDGSSWSRLPVGADSTVELTKPEPGGDTRSVRFQVPGDLEATTVAGHDGHWIRGRLVGGAYGEVIARKQSDDSWVSRHEVTPPRFGSVSLRYHDSDLSKPARHVVTENNLAHSGDLADRDQFAPFTRVPDTEQTLYLGFDGALDDGPINLFFALAGAQYPDDFHSRVRWEFEDGPTWRRLSVSDGTEGLTERGIVGVTFPARTTPAERFGRESHWMRARVAGTAFADSDSEADDSPEDTGSRDELTGVCGAEPCGVTVETEPPGGRPRNRFPVVEGLFHNTTWLRNVRTVPEEVLGSSSDDPDQTFRVSSPPVTEIEVWVDERRALSEGERRDLEAERPDRVETETDSEGDLRSFWVRWERVDTFLESGDDDRHYVLTPATGDLQFGDGERGRIPPRGTDNLKASYETGGGEAGNVPADAISDLKSSVPYVDAVTNPVSADGGADIESTNEVLERAPKELRDRDRAVTEADFERIAADASRRLARTRCYSGMNPAGESESGWVTVLIVPDSGREMPVPSVTLREEVHAHVSGRAPATLVGDPDQLVVRGPSYVGVSVAADLVTTGVGSVSTLEETAATEAAAFLHPLTGGDDGDGWAFGDAPCLSDLYGLFEAIDGVDHVSDLELEFQGDDESVRVREGDTEPTLGTDALVYSGTHEVTAHVADDTGGDA